MITIGCLFLLVGLAGARVDFYASQIFDEFDFKGQSSASVSIDGPCEVSCAIYASITQESSKKGSNLLIQLPSGFVSVADLASRIDPTTNEKWPLIVNNTAKLTVVNGNANKDAGPLVLYAFDGRHSDLPSGRAFDADGLNLPIDQLPLRLTVMSARPFTIQQAARDQPSKQGMRATLTGFDGMDDSACVDLYYT
ncbi:hypothetical protein PRIPAC_98080 [Pristionchus pacificus]|uniref:Uncharacterized protein n=1 Tax=Pristionchus pacificus TaxID=54126 RepID=A0A454XY94_PRIPA|nr:hypothetical protein PRIPAC_98080 [Pristionchus pacificus]|eukprot:PDM60202.1 hypothetical protein PRIPAC_54027 [Pristionchus pacificus]